MLRLIFILLFPGYFLFPQQYAFDYSFGKFKNASSFYINPAGIIYISDSGSDEIYSYDTLGTFIDETGGYGWTESAFDDPADIFATTLNIYVCDKNNHRIQRFDKDLNFISELSRRESDNPDEEFGYPLSCATSPQGDLYILDSENKRIVKFDLFGNFIQNFGSYDAGGFTLNSPLKLSISPSNFLYIAEENRVVVFDQYGNGIGIINISSLENIRIIFSSLTANTKDEVYYTDLSDPEFKLNKIIINNLEDDSEFVSAGIFNQKLYLLLNDKILVCRKVK